MNTKQIIEKYGKPGENLVTFRIPYPMKLAWDLDVIISKFQCHDAIAARLDKIFSQTLKEYGIQKIQDLRLDLFGGCFNIRKMRGGTELSVHSWGLAVDIDPANNPLRLGKDKAPLAKKEYDKFWEIVYNNGGVSLGKERNYDWMHFQFIPI